MRFGGLDRYKKTIRSMSCSKNNDEDNKFMLAGNFY